MIGLWLLIFSILSSVGYSSTSAPMLDLQIFRNAHAPNPVTNEGPIFSPDGTKMVFPLITSDGTQQLFLANSDGSEPVQITFEGHRNHSPAWSPCGGQILFVSDRDGDDEIFMMDADGSYQHQLTANEGWDGLPAWSPDGREILFTSDQKGTVERYVMTDGAGTITAAEFSRIVEQTP
jgi:Tol biopolymer transport system component